MADLTPAEVLATACGHPQWCVFIEGNSDDGAHLVDALAAAGYRVVPEDRVVPDGYRIQRDGSVGVLDEAGNWTAAPHLVPEESDPTPALPSRRLNLKLDLGADDMDSLYRALLTLANDLEYEGAETREVTSGGYDSGFHLVLTCDPDQTGDRFRDQIRRWSADRKAVARG